MEVKGPTLLGKIKESNFDSDKHLGMWVQLSLNNIQTLLKGDEDLNFHFLSYALLLDLPIKEVQEDWEGSSKPVMDILEDAALRFSNLGQIIFTNYPIRSRGRESAIDGLLVTIKLGKHNAVTDNQLILTLGHWLRGEAMLKNSRSLPTYPGELTIAPPMFDSLFPSV